jgi:tetratricopeptide (TPR) repeat protein
LPGNSNLFRGLAGLFSEQDRKREAIAHYQKLVAVETAEENDYRNLAELYLATGDTAQAIAALEKVQELVPQDLEIRQKLSRLYPSAGNHSLAGLQALELQQRQSPNDVPTLLALGKLYYRARDFAKCVATLEPYVAAAPEDFYTREYLGRAYFALQKYSEAFDQFNAIVAENPKHAEAWALLGVCAKELKDWAGARRYVYRALAVDNKCGFAYLALGEIYEQAARDCLAAGSANDFSSKLVFKLAYEQYQKALMDSRWQGEAQRRIHAIVPLLPDEDDYFVNKNQDRPQGDCFSWIYK